jgi:hypothetical protein
MVRVGNGNGKRIGFIGAFERRFRQEERDHRLDLLLFGVAGADDRFLDQVRRIFGNAQAEPRRSEKDGAARLPELQRRSWIFVDEGLLDRRLIAGAVNVPA